MNKTSFGPNRPSIAVVGEKYWVPCGLQQVDIPSGIDETTVKGWSGYLLELDGLTKDAFERAVADLPPGDYSDDLQAVLTNGVYENRRAEYPPVEMYLDGVVKSDDAQIAAYIAACQDVKLRFPLPG